MGNGVQTSVDRASFVNLTPCKSFSEFRTVHGDNAQYLVEYLPGTFGRESIYRLKKLDPQANLWQTVCKVDANECVSAAARIQSCYYDRNLPPPRQPSVELVSVLGNSIDESTRTYVRDLLYGKGCVDFVLTERALVGGQFTLQLGCYKDKDHQSLKTFCSVPITPNTDVGKAVRECRPSI